MVVRKFYLVTKNAYRRSLSDRGAMFLSTGDTDIWYRGIRMHFQDQDMRIFLLLIVRQRNLTHYKEITDILYGDREDGGPDNPYGVLSTRIYRLRQICLKIGLDIINVHGLGWQLRELREMEAAE